MAGPWVPDLFRPGLNVLTAAQAAAVDRRTIEEVGIPGPVLMETAGRAVARVVLEYPTEVLERGIVVCCGPGNNGGDGFVIARALGLRRWPVEVVLLGDPDRLRGDAAWAWRLLGSESGNVRRASDADFRGCGLIVDALFGTGLDRALEGEAAELVMRMNAAGVPIISVDIPSGVNGTTGEVPGPAVKATTTVTIGFLKRGLLLYPGAAQCGELRIAEIGFPPSVIKEEGDGISLADPELVSTLLPAREGTAHKGTSGRVAIVAGSVGMTGAAMLSTRAALRAGAGLVFLGLAESLNATIEPAILEALTHPLPDAGRGWLGEDSLEAARAAVSGAKAVAIGPGVGRRPETLSMLRTLISEVEQPMVVDADALQALAPGPRKSTGLIITPHPGEMSRLMDRPVADILADPIGTARECAARYEVVTLLKGAHTVIARPDGNVYINPTGNPGMASGGMGDVLTGIIVALLADEELVLGPHLASIVGAFLHGRAADRVVARRGERGLVASDVIEELPATIREVQQSPGSIPFPRVV